MAFIPLPGGGPFTSPYTTPWHRTVAENNTVLLSQVGSGLHGVTLGDQDDRDEMGFAIEPPTVMLGHDHFEMYLWRSQPDGHRSGPGDLDLNIYGMHKFTKLLANGNPTVLMMLFAPESELTRKAWPGAEIREQKDMFLSRAAGERFLKYGERQLERFRGSLSQRTNRPELVAQHGYDTKFAYHAIRLGLQGEELMTTGTITLPMPEKDREWLLDVRRGVFTHRQVDHFIDDAYNALAAAIQVSTLPDKADWDRVSKWCAGIYQAWWAETRQRSVSPKRKPFSSGPPAPLTGDRWGEPLPPEGPFKMPSVWSEELGLPNVGPLWKDYPITRDEFLRRQGRWDEHGRRIKA